MGVDLELQSRMASWGAQDYALAPTLPGTVRKRFSYTRHVIILALVLLFLGLGAFKYSSFTTVTGGKPALFPDNQDGVHLSDEDEPTPSKEAFVGGYSDMMVGGYGECQTVDEEVLQSLEVAVKTINEGNSSIEGVQLPLAQDSVTIVTAHSQVVAGMNYRITFDAVDAAGRLHRLEATVFVPLPYTGEQPSLSAANRLPSTQPPAVGGPWTAFAPDDAARAAAEAALAAQNAMSNALFPPELDSVCGSYAAPMEGGGRMLRVLFRHVSKPQGRDGQPASEGKWGVGTAHVWQDANGGLEVQGGGVL